MSNIPSIKPLGIGDLTVVRQKLARYEAGEIAHIENIMAHERRARNHRRLQQYELTTVVEKVHEEENKRDLQSTERFELQQEIQKTIRSETSFQAGVDISGGFGPVKITASAKYATNDSVEESNKNSTKYAKEIVENSVNRLFDKIREERTSRTLEEIEEKNDHEFNNLETDQQFASIFRWVDKYYRIKQINYGKRLFYEFYVPEPAYLYLFTTKYNYENSVLPVLPHPPVNPNTGLPLSPSDITRDLYPWFVMEYHPEEIQAPPPHSIFISKAITRDYQESEANFIWSYSNEDLKIPQGYEAYWITIHSTTLGSDKNPTFFEIEAGAASSFAFLSYTDQFYEKYSVSLTPLIDKIPIIGSGQNFFGFTLNVELQCTLTNETFQNWQLQTYDAIMKAYKKSLMEYEERLAAAQIQEGVKIGGDNPEINRSIEREELKRACITLWTSYQFDNTPCIESGDGTVIPPKLPEIKLGIANSNVELIKFLEQAFDWDNITYEFYPYYWARKDKWIELYALENPDPLFEKFLKAGFARVKVPVQPSFTPAVLYYQWTGLIPQNSDIPALSPSSDPEVRLYNSYLEEIKDEEDLPDITKEIEIRKDDPDTWLVKIPTSLVWLQGDSNLPNLEAE